MTDPAVEAAERAWENNGWPLPIGLSEGHLAIDAAREALAPLRELHRPHDRAKSIYRALNDPHTIVCNHCLGPIEWPCATARLIYRGDEL